MIGSIIAGALGGSAISTVGQLGNTALQAYFNAKEAEKSRDFQASQAAIDREFNASQAQLARDFEERMSSTAYQRSKADMEAAGINPALQYLNSAGAASASTPSGQAASFGGSGGSAAASIGPPKIDPVGSFLEISNAAAQTAMTKAKMDDLGSEKEYKAALTAFYKARQGQLDAAAQQSARDWAGYTAFDKKAAMRGMTADDYADFLSELAKTLS